MNEAEGSKAAHAPLRPALIFIANHTGERASAVHIFTAGCMRKQGRILSQTTSDYLHFAGAANAGRIHRIHDGYSDAWNRLARMSLCSWFPCNPSSRRQRVHGMRGKERAAARVRRGAPGVW